MVCAICDFLVEITLGSFPTTDCYLVDVVHQLRVAPGICCSDIMTCELFVAVSPRPDLQICPQNEWNFIQFSQSCAKPTFDITQCLATANDSTWVYF